ncbi:transferring glycosyl group transferase [Perilla frutescens var. frutescens]|nr:transferring glycosyl group transferase [Perilla frutescens var. frutescens]
MKLSMTPLLTLSLLSLLSASPSPAPTPAPWPVQFHSILVLNTSKGLLQINDLWYDWPSGRNVNIITQQLGGTLYDVEWDNGTSFYYTTGAKEQCQTMLFPVGILRPDFLDGAEYLGQVEKDGFLCNLWTKVDFIWYYEDVVTKRPVAWDFYSGMTTQVMTFEVGKVLDSSKWQAPSYCFDESKIEQDDDDDLLQIESPFGLMRAVSTLTNEHHDVVM